MNRPRPVAGEKGFSILELLVALIIIGILVAILIPIVANRAAEARIARANSDLEMLANGLERFAVDMSYYPRMFMLNDTIGGDGIGTRDPKATGDYIDGVRDYGSLASPATTFQNTNRLFIEPQTGDLVTAGTGASLLSLLIANETSFNFHGPYVNWQKDANSRNVVGGPNGLPDDPWGNDYLLFTRAGLVLEPDGQVVVSANFPIGGTAVVSGVNCKVFDRATVLSLGPNGLPGNGGTGDLPGTGDDLFRVFGQ